jgi:protein-disulfide isomerase
MIASFLRLLLVTLGVALLTAAAPVRDWSIATRQLPNGAFVTGNPAASIKLVEYGSYTCSHCAAFSVESRAGLRGQMIKSGKVSLEYRHLIRDRLDLGAAILARCGGARGFVGASEAIFAAQSVWLQKIIDWQGAHPEVAQMDAPAQIKAYVAASGLDALMRARGLTPVAMTACLNNRAEIDRIVKMTGDAPIEVRGTPSFFVNGEMQPVSDWAHLEPILRAKGAK